MAFVLLVIAFLISSESIVQVSLSISTRTGVIPELITALIVAANVMSGTITSSPGPMPNVFSAS